MKENWEAIKEIELTNLRKLKNKVEGELYNNDPIVRKSLEFYHHGDIPYENALLAAIIYLSEKASYLQKELALSKMRESPDYGNLLKKHGGKI